MKNLTDLSLDELCINTIRTLSIDAVQKANSGHPGLPLGAAPMAYCLWTQFLKHNPTNPQWFDRDRFILSAGHGSALLYSLLHLTGYDLPMEQIKNFRQWESKTPGHPERGETPGVEITTGPLGQGFGNGVGFAIAEAYLAARYNKPDFKIIDHYTYAIVSDGDLMEGVACEAASLAGHLGLGKLVYLYDDNHITLSAETKLAFTEDVLRRFEACGWHVQQVEDGNNLQTIHEAISRAKAETGKPSLIMIKTIIGFGSPHKQGTFEAHGSPLGEEEVKLTKQALGWPTEPAFYLPPEAVDHLREAVQGGQAAEKSWKEKFDAYTKKYPAEGKELGQIMNNRLVDGWHSGIPLFPADAKGVSTRVAGGKVLNAIAAKLPSVIGGSADLDPSTFTTLIGMGNFQDPKLNQGQIQGEVGGGWNYAGRNIAFGIREHAMGSAVNGIAAHGGLIPFSATFFTFSDYMRPAIRLASLMRLHSIFVFTHDSVALGEDGPTHQSVEHLAALRAIPDLNVIRPCDANETAVAWKTAIETQTGPTVLVLTRQNLSTLDRTKYASADNLKRGAYVLADAAGGKPDMILIATGSEVGLIVAAQEKLAQQGVKARLVSMPSWELFDAEPQEYRDSVLLPSVKVRLSVEAGVSLGWHKYVTDEGGTVSIDRFGASAPGPVVMEKLGFTVDNVVNHALALIRKGQLMKNNPLVELGSYGQGVWLDYIRRDLFSSGELKQLIEKDGLTGMTSNPTIFEKAISSSADYDVQLRELLAQDPNTPTDVLYEKVAIKDIQAAADSFLPVYQRTQKADGYVSLEVSPDLARDTQGTLSQARRLWATVARPNLMIKVPSTKEGIPAIETLIAEGINVNITLMFTMAHYEAVAQAYIRGLQRAKNPKDIASVASFFVSRVDTVVDKALETIGTPEARKLCGQVAIANSKMVYRRFLEIFEGPSFASLRQKGARVQRPLWASTGTKNPNYSDVLYVAELAGRDTVNTMPPETLEHFRDHGVAKKDAVQAGQPQEILQSLAKLGIDLNAVGEKLQDDGVDSFAASFKKLLSALEEKRKTMLKR